MLAYNHIIVIGNLTRDPDIRTVGGAGMKLARMSMCINERRKTQEGKIVDNPVFVDVDAWNRLAEICEKYLSKNSTIFVEGKLQMSQREKDGVKHQKLKIRAHNIKFFPKGNKYSKGNGKSASKDVGKEEEQVPQDAETYVPEDPPEITDDENFVEAMKGW